MSGPTWMDINHALAEAYSEAAHAGAEMRRATDALESLRDVVNARQNHTTILATLDEQIGRAELDRLMPTLVRLRDQFESSVVEQTVDQLNEAYSTDPATGWKSWLEAYSRSFDDRRWSRGLAVQIAAKGLRSSPLPEWPVERIQDQLQQALRGGWPETYDWFLFLATQDLPKNERVTFLCIAAEIQIYHFLRPAGAKKLLEQCDSIAPDYHVVHRCWGAYWLLLENVEEARKCFDRIVRERPDLADGFVGLGDCCEKAKDLTTAETYYNQAVSNAPGMADGYSKLLNWHGRPEWFEKREALLEPIFRRALALTDYKPSAWVDLGCIYRLNQRYEKARQCFEEAIRLDPDYPLGYTWMGYAWFEEAMTVEVENPASTELLEKAQVYFLKTVEMAPTSFSGYWAMLSLEVYKKEWEPALEWCERALQCHAEWEPFLKVRRAEIYRQLGQLEKAEQDLTHTLELEPDYVAAADVLSDLATSFENINEQDGAIAAMEQWRRLKGESSEYLFQNRLGNLAYRSGNYAVAASRYRLAIAAAPGDAVLHSNLALALEHLRQPGGRREELDEAVAELRLALKNAPNTTEYTERLRNLEAERQFVLAYGEDATKLEPGVTPIRIDVRAPLFSDILNERFDDLSSDTLEKTQALRARIRERYGVTVPVVNFGELASFYSWHQYRILILERDEYGGDVEPGGRFVPSKDSAPSDSLAPAGTWINNLAQPSDSEEVWTVADYLLHHAQNVLEQRLFEFFGHQETYASLEETGTEAAKAILDNPDELTRAVQVFRSLLRMRIPIRSIDVIATEFVRMRESGSDLDAITDELANTLATEPAAQREQTRA